MKEFYVDKPAEIEVYSHGGATDIILRKNIAQEQDEDGNERWTCEERQVRQLGTISAASVKSDFSGWWAVAGGEEPLDAIKARKAEEMSAACRQAIIAGFDVTLSDGKDHHFSLTVEDQLNLNALFGLLASGAEQVPYHADGETCMYFTAADMQVVVQEATAHKTYHESYFNSLKAYIASKRTAASVESIEYGTEIPAQYQSDVLKALLAEA